MAGLALFAVVGVYQARPYLEVSRAHAAARRSIEQVRHYSAPPKAFLAATRQNRVWSGATARVRNSLSSPDESSLFPGVAIVVLALLGVTSAVYTRGLRVGLGIGVLVCAVLSLGLGIATGRFSYRLLFDYAPGWDGVRTPGRIVTLTSLGLALLAGAGAQRVVSGAARPRARAGGRRGAAASWCWPRARGRCGSRACRRVPKAQIGLRSPQLHLPIHPSNDRLYQLWSVQGFPKIFNGVSTFDLPTQERVRRMMRLFPSRRSISELRALGIRTVVLHTDLDRVPLPPPETTTSEPADPRQAAAKPVAGFGVTVRRAPGVVIYEIRRKA